MSGEHGNLRDTDPPAKAIEIGSQFVPTADQVEMINKLSGSLEVHRSYVEQALYFALRIKPPPVGEELTAEVSAWVLENHPRFTEESDDDNEDMMDTAGGDAYEYKMVFIINEELKMTAGKIGAQVGHGAVQLYAEISQNPMTIAHVQQWNHEGSKKVVLKGKDTKQLFDLKDKATGDGLKVALIQDAGKTQVLSGSVTCLGIFGQAKDVDRVTGTLTTL